jgi:hypothetical protein
LTDFRIVLGVTSWLTGMKTTFQSCNILSMTYGYFRDRGWRGALLGFNPTIRQSFNPSILHDRSHVSIKDAGQVIVGPRADHLFQHFALAQQQECGYRPDPIFPGHVR